MATSQESRADRQQDDEDRMPPEFTPTSLVWLPQPKSGKGKGRTEHGWLQALKHSQDNEFHMWRLMEISLPPLLARKYHIINVAELMKDGADRQYMGVATWFVMWSQAFGVQFLNTVEQKYLEFVKLEKDRISANNKVKMLAVKCKQNEWRDSVNEILKLIRQANKMDSAPRLKDNCSNSSEFLLEPCIIIQLPWNNVLLHQWLLAALVEVLIFEKSSLELKHWPFPPEIEPTARELSCTVKKLKQRIILGFVILSQQVSTLPEVDSKHPGWILDEVVLPSLATLQFLISGKAFTILKSIKKQAWSKSEAFGNRVYIHPMIHTMDTFLTEFFFKCGYNILWWSDSIGCSPFPKESSEEIEEVIKRLQHNQCKVSPEVLDILEERKIHSIEEVVVIRGVLKAQESPILHMSVDEKIELTLNTIKELLSDTGRIPKSLCEKLHQFLTADQVKEKILKEFKFSDKLNDINLIIINSLMYWNIHAKLLDKEKENSVIARIMNLGLELLEREQIIRLSNIACTMFIEKVTPVAANTSRSTSMSVKSMTEILQELEAKQKTYSRDCLWSQFPAEWRKPVSLKEPSLNKTGVVITVSNIVKTCEERIGRIVFNVARESFKVFEKGGEVFQHWQTVQYILPCIVASYVEFMKDEFHPSHYDKLSNFFDFLDEILKFYETNFHDWFKRIKPRQLIKQQEHMTEEIIKEIIVNCKYYKELNYILQVAHIGSSADTPCEGLHGFGHVINSLLCWPIFISNCNSYSNVLKYCKVWVENAFYFLRNLYEISVKTWKPVMPGSHETSEKIVREIYFADSVLAYLYSLQKICFIYLSQSPVQQLLQESQLEPLLPSMQFRFDVFFTATGFKHKEFSKKELKNIFEEGRKLMVKMYEALKSFRIDASKVEPKFTLDNIPNRPPELKLAVKYYINADFNALDKMLEILTEDGKKPVKSFKTPKSAKGEKLKFPENPTSSKSTEGPFQQCRNCPKTERKWGPFKACEECVKQKYPDVNYFCSKECKEKWWKEEHMAEHLEYELGLLDFSHLKK